MTNGSFDTSASAGRYLHFYWEQRSPSVANNTSVIAWEVRGKGDAGYVICGPIKVVINNETVFYDANRVKVYPETVVANGEYTFHHADDGQGFTAASVEAAIYSGSVNCTGFSWIALDMIARASQPSCVTWPDTTQNIGDMGRKITIHMNRKSAAFTHTVRYAFGNASGTIATGVGDNCEWTIPIDLAAQIPNATSGWGTITVETYNGNALVGTKSVKFTATVPDSIKPTVDAPTVTEATAGLAAKFGAFVQGKSTLKIVSDPKGAQGSTIKKCKVTVDGSTYSGKDITTNPITASGTVRITVSIKDSRGRSASVTKDVTVVAYSPPKILAFKVQRCRSDGTLDESGTAFKVTMHFEISPVGSKNDRNFAVQVQEQGATAWTDAWSGQASYSYDSAKVLTSVVLAASKSYTVRLLLSDYFVQNYGAEADVQSSFRLFNFTEDGKSFALGKFAELLETFEVALKTIFTNLVELKRPSGDTYYFATRTDTGTRVGMGIGSSGVNHGLWSSTLNKWLIHGDGANVFVNGQYPMHAKHANGFWGLLTPGASDTEWIRTTKSGLIPYASGGASSDLGTSGWRFNKIYGNTVDVSVLLASAGIRVNGSTSKIRFHAFSAVGTVNLYGLFQVATPAQVNSWFGVSNSGAGNTAVFVCNGDNDAYGGFAMNATYAAKDGKWYVGYNNVNNGKSARANCFVIYWG